MYKISSMNTNSILRVTLFAAASLFAMLSRAETIFVLTADGKVATTLSSSPSTNSAPIAVANLTAGEALVAIDVRPLNQQLYALGVNATTDTATLYLVNPKTGFMGVVGTPAAVALTSDGIAAVDFLDPSAVNWEIDFNPVADRLRVAVGSLNFRINPNTGLAVDGDTGVTGTNPDGAINGGATTVSATAYTNNNQNTIWTTQYSVDAASDSLFIQNLPNNGTLTLVQTVTLGGSALDFTVAGLDIAPGINAPGLNATLTSGSAIFYAKVGGVSGLYSLNLVNAQATLLGTFDIAVRSIAIRTDKAAAVGLSNDGSALFHFDPNTPSLSRIVAVAAPVAGEKLVGIDGRPQTGQLIRANALPIEKCQQIGKVPSSITLLAFDTAF